MVEVVQVQVLYVASLVGSVAFALSGFMAGARKSLDIMGIFILSFLTANGGGILRDLLADRPPNILVRMEPFWVVLAVTAIALAFRLHKRAMLEKRWFFVAFDAIGLVSFSISGSLIAIDEQTHFFGFLTLSFLTAAGGGILRDLLVGNVPEILQSGFYGSIAILLSVGVYALHISHLLTPVTLLLIFLAALAVRLVAYAYDWRLPKLKVQKD